MEKSFQDYYPEHLSYCYGCGRLNPDGMQIKSYWDGEESVCTVEPRAYHIAVPGFVYGGFIASVIDCHGTGTAAAAAYRADGRPLGSEPPHRFLTAALKVDYLKPTPMGPLTLRGKVTEAKGRKVIVAVELFAQAQLCARGEVIAVEIPEHVDLQARSSV